MSSAEFWTYNAAEAVAAAAAVVGIAGVFFAGIQLRDAKRAQETQLLLAIQERFRNIPSFTDFLYRLDYSGPKAWRFDPKTFPHSPEEAVLDGILYEFAFVGSLVATRDLQAKDLVWLKSWISIVLRSQQVQAYLTWLRSQAQLPDHDAFEGAIALYRAIYGEDRAFADLRRSYPKS